MEVDKEAVGPFITVVSVDGGLQCGNKLTVITPTEINESFPKGSKSLINSNTGESNFSTDRQQQLSAFKGKVSAIPTLVGIDRKANSKNLTLENVTPPSASGTAYVTVVALSDQEKAEAASTIKALIKSPTSGIPVKSYKNHINTKSIVRLGNENEPNPITHPSPTEKQQIITISNKVKGNHHQNAKNSSIIEISKDDEDNEIDSSWLFDESIEIPTKIKEHVTVYRLPGERLGFGLRFEGGVTSSTEKVKHLYIQSCAAESPSNKAKTSWGHLGEGDEIIEIQSVPVNTLTRMDCIQNLKDASVAVRLFVRHSFTPEELSLLKAQREIAIKKMKSPNKKKENAQNKLAGETASKNEHKQTINNNKGNDFSSSTSNESKSNGQNQRLTREGSTLSSSMLSLSTCSKIPVPKSKQSNTVCEDDDNDNNNNYNDKINNKKISHEEQSLQDSIVSHTEEDYKVLAAKDVEEEESHLMRLKPPTGFADELFPQYYHHHSSISSSNSNSEGNKKFGSNNKLPQPAEPQFYLNAISPSNSHRLSGCSSSLSENYSCGESDETGSSRSTVVSRLSMTSSISSSISTNMSISGDNLMNSITHINTTNSSHNNNNNNNNNHLVLNKRKSSLTSVGSCPEGVEPEPVDLLSSSTNMQNHMQYQKQSLSDDPHKVGAEDDLHSHSHHPMLLVQSDSNNVSTIPCITGDLAKTGIVRDDTPSSLSLSEIPLTPPLFFQDQRVLSARNSNNAEENQPTRKSNVKKADEVEYSMQMQQNHLESELALINSVTEDWHNKNQSQNSGNEKKKEQPVGAKANRVIVNNNMSPVLTSSTLTSNGNKSKDEIGQAENGNVNVRSCATNWEQKGIAEEYDDHDELALLAEELGLEDQEEDEELFNTLVAEIDEINNAEVVGSFDNNNRKRADELIHQTFNEIHFKGKENISNAQEKMQQRDQLCPTLSSHYEKGDETRDVAKSSTKNDVKQKEASCRIFEQQGDTKDAQLSVMRNNPSSSTRETNVSRRSGYSKNKDSIEDLNNGEDEFNRSSCNAPSNNDRLFPPFSKVVEPINTKIMTSEREQPQQQKQQKQIIQPKEQTYASESQLKKQNGSFALENGVNLKEEVVDSLQAPAPPPRTKGVEKRGKDERYQESDTAPKPKQRVSQKWIDAEKHPQDRPASAATIVRIDTWNDSVEGKQKKSNFSPSKLEARRYNSLTLPCSETSVINPEESAFALNGKRERDDDKNSRDDHENDDETSGIDDSSHKDKSLVPSAAKQGSSINDPTASTPSASSMESSTELLRRHQFVPPTFNRLPPDGDEFPNSCWSDERHQQGLVGGSSAKKLYRSELTLQKSSSECSSGGEPGSPPPLPTTEPPREDISCEDLVNNSSTAARPPPLPVTVPPIPPKKMATRRCSFDDRKKLFENGSSIIAPNNKMPTHNNSNNTFSSPTTTKAEEPSKKSVRDKIAMFSSRSSSSEDSTDSSAVFPKPNTNHVSSSLSKSTMNISNVSSAEALSKSSENLLAMNSVERKGSVDLNSSITSQNNASVNFNSKPTPFYGTLNGSNKVTTSTTTNSYGQAPSLYERSQSLIDVGLSSSGGVGGVPNGINNGASYQNTTNSENNQTYTSYKYSSNTTGRPVSTIMEQRRKCITKLRGLVIPDSPGDALGNSNKVSASVVDLPTIISKDAIISPQMNHNHNKPPLYSNGIESLQVKKSLSRTESLDRFASMGETNLYNNRNNTNNSAKSNEVQNNDDTDLNADWKFPNLLPKYSPAFKRRGLTAYQSSLVSPTLNAKNNSTGQQPTLVTNANSKYNNVRANSTPEPKSLESLTSPRSESSFEFSNSPSPDNKHQQQQEVEKPIIVKRPSFEKPVEQAIEVNVESEQNNVENKSQQVSNGKFGTKGSGKLEDSDNDSAVSSSRSSISHGLSPPNSPTPESTAATPDPDRRNNSGEEDQDKQEISEDSANMDESWRILKPTSIEAINRKNVLKSAKFSSGGGDAPPSDNGTDDSSLSSSNGGKNRRSDDDEASYADAETEDTESSCSELEGTGNRRRMIVAGRVNLSQRHDSKADTEDDEDNEPQQISAVNMEFTELTESPLQAIYDMEVKMAYINEVCDALNDRGRSELSSRYFSRRDSEATVIERPIEPKRKMSTDTVDNSSSVDRRARNRSSSGNESDFSSNVSVGSQQNNHKSLSREPSNNGLDSDRWSMLEKKYSKSMTSVNSLGGGKGEQQQQQQTLTSAPSVPKIVTSASEVVEKKIEKIIEKTCAEGSPKKVTSANIPRGRNDFKSIAEKWQLIEKSSDTKTTKPVIPEKPTLSPQNSSGLLSGSPSFRNRLTSPPPPSSSTPSSARSLSKTNSSELASEESPSSRPLILSGRTSSSIPSSNNANNKSSMEAIEADRAWAEKRRSDGGGASRHNQNQEPIIPMSSTKRSVSVNDIRKAFEKAEIAVSAYGRDSEGINPSDTKKDAAGGLTLPAAHFRVSSFDSTTSEESSATTPAGIYGSSNSLVSSVPRDPYGSITSLASSTSLISPQELQQLIDEANQSLEEAGTPSHEVSVVILHREFAGGSLGITLAGGADYETKEITVHKVLTASIADRDGRIYRGDRILSINGKSTKGLTHRDALNLLKTPRTEVVLVISRGRPAGPNGFQTIEETSALDRAVEPLLNGNLVIENDDDTCYKWGPLKTATLIKDGAGLGFSLEGGKGSIQGDKPLTVKKIFIGGPAEKSGELKVGDLIVSINSINMSTKSRTEAWNFMKKLNDGDVKINVRSPIL